MGRIPRLRISGWLPGTKDHDTVSIQEDKGNGFMAYTPFLVGVPLYRAKQIVEAFELLREIQDKTAARD